MPKYKIVIEIELIDSLTQQEQIEIKRDCLRQCYKLDLFSSDATIVEIKGDDNETD